MPQTATYDTFPLARPLARLVTHRFAPLMLLVVVALVAWIAAVVAFGLVVLTLTATMLVPVVFVLLMAVAGR
jgi:hypothetical protein